jgi:hypothetical protein
MGNLSQTGDNGGITEYHIKKVNKNSVHFFGVDPEIDPTEGIDKEKLIECKSCGEFLSWVNYNFVLKGCTTTLKKTLNSRTCKSCTNKHSRELNKLKKENPKPPKGTKCTIDECNNTDLHLDHNHETGEFRGWICTNHNTGIGKIGDTLEDSIKILKYLLKTENNEEIKIKSKKEIKMVLNECF